MVRDRRGQVNDSGELGSKNHGLRNHCRGPINDGGGFVSDCRGLTYDCSGLGEPDCSLGIASGGLADDECRLGDGCGYLGRSNWQRISDCCRFVTGYDGLRSEIEGSDYNSGRSVTDCGRLAGDCCGLANHGF